MRAALAFVVIIALASCAPLSQTKPVEPSAVITVTKSMGLRQCEGGTVSPTRLAAELKRAGVAVQSSTCGSDGMMRPAVCGGGTDHMGVFTIRAQDEKTARKAGFGPMPANGRVMPCRI